MENLQDIITRNNLKFIIIAILYMIISSCSNNPKSQFLIILDGVNDTINIEEEEIVSYNWDSHEIVLSKGCIDKLLTFEVRHGYTFSYIYDEEILFTGTFQNAIESTIVTRTPIFFVGPDHRIRLENGNRLQLLAYSAEGRTLINKLSKQKERIIGLNNNTE
jgi:hypothetical protein